MLVVDPLYEQGEELGCEGEGRSDWLGVGESWRDGVRSFQISLVKITPRIDFGIFKSMLSLKITLSDTLYYGKMTYIAWIVCMFFVNASFSFFVKLYGIHFLSSTHLSLAPPTVDIYDCLCIDPRNPRLRGLQIYAVGAVGEEL